VEIEEYFHCPLTNFFNILSRTVLVIFTVAFSQLITLMKVTKSYDCDEPFLKILNLS